MKNKTKLVLENGVIFDGFVLGSEGETIGEVCFNTGMTGYQEILTDPSYCGQLITMTYPHIGNYGTNKEDIESHKIHASGLIIKEETIIPSNYISTESLGEYLKNENIIGIQGIDTRMLVRIIRDQGAMNGLISSKQSSNEELINKVKSSQSMNGLDLAKHVTCNNKYQWKNHNANNNNLNYDYKIAVLDFGVKYNILRMLNSLGCDLTIFPANTSAEEILEFNPDGVFLSNGPGDPAPVQYGIMTVKKLIGKKPLFGICLGHQILALALGGKTYKLKFGHRGCNHPVKNLENNAIEITSQNHGFSVDEKSLSKNIKITHTSLNDNTVEGLSCQELSLFSVQYHPESSPGPHDSQYLFKKFITMLSNKKINV